MIVPLGMTIYFSFIRKNLLNPELTGFAGFENYRYLWEDPAFIPAIINSVVLIGSVLIITVVLGTLLAVLFDREFFGKNLPIPALACSQNGLCNFSNVVDRASPLPRRDRE
jgi:sorbitol/mannitol transport system permease protein